MEQSFETPFQHLQLLPPVYQVKCVALLITEGMLHFPELPISTWKNSIYCKSLLDLYGKFTTGKKKKK